MTASCPLPSPDTLALLDDLHARYDGRPPQRQRLAALMAGNDVLDLAVGQARRQRLLAQAWAARLAVARRRGQVAADHVLDDAWLFRLSCALGEARKGIVGLADGQH
ncbi:hypothetical protein [Niveispirillum sp.]|uniref:hypothetical protein n=1 Tax=Niveispirillum sp. TaxID=1917217 RepID=UPI001B4876A8|nr:hypothetical protein [Niveispirillum sp.]MBP7334924.1 hypothetical protein [Niveispirillum sp.]